MYVSEHGFDPTGINSAVVNATGTIGITADPPPAEFCGCPTIAKIATAVCTDKCGDLTAPGTYVHVDAALTHTTIIAYPGLNLPTTITGFAIVRLN